MQGDDFTRQILHMYETFEDFLEHQQQHHPTSIPESAVFSPPTSPPPPPAPSHQCSTRRKMTGRPRRRRADGSGGSGSGSRDDISSSGGASESCTPLVATIRGIQECRRGGQTSNVGSGEDVDELFPPGPAPCRNFPSHLLSPAPPGLHPSSVDSLSCGGYAGTNSIDSGYKSACPTPDLSDSLYPESLFLRGSSGGLISPRPRIAMGTRMMSRSSRVGSDPTYYEEIDASQVPSLFQRRPSTSPGPRVGGTSSSSRPRSASTGSRSSPATLGGGSRRALRSSPHMSSTGSLTSSHLPYSRHSSPGGTYSSPGSAISASSRRNGSPHNTRGDIGIGTLQSSSSQLALLEREIDALLTGTASDHYPGMENSHEISRARKEQVQLCSRSEDLPARPPHPPNRLRGNYFKDIFLFNDRI